MRGKAPTRSDGRRTFRYVGGKGNESYRQGGRAVMVKVGCEKGEKYMALKHRVLVVDDEESIREFLEIMLKKEGYSVTCAENGAVAQNILQKKSFDLVISDFQMPEMTGMELLKFVKEYFPQTVFMMITAFGTTESAVEAMKVGAYDYITKPFKIDEARINIAHALRSQTLEKENRYLKKELGREYSFQNLIGNTSKMHEIFEMIKRVCHAPTNILITGDSGTGKELIAKSIHYNGDLKSKSFVTINCGAIPENLMESEMFGHKKGLLQELFLTKKVFSKSPIEGLCF